MSKAEYKEFDNYISNSSNKGEAKKVLAIRCFLKRYGFSYDIKTIQKFYSLDSDARNFEKAVRIFENLGEDIMNGINYLMAQSKKEDIKFFNITSYYVDYRDIAKKYKLGRSKEVRYPPHFIAAHDRAVEIQNAILDEKIAKKNRALEEKYCDIHKKNLEQYEFSADGFSIIVPKTSRDIIAEGRNMQHCVGGYAERHLQGKLTILFLRKTAEPNKSLYTIEMHGIALTQVQGKGNRTPLTPEAKVFFETWLSWVKEGSKRDKDGKPKFKEDKIIKFAV